jgi:hypothetical protein
MNHKLDDDKDVCEKLRCLYMSATTTMKSACKVYKTGQENN